MIVKKYQSISPGSQKHCECQEFVGHESSLNLSFGCWLFSCWRFGFGCWCLLSCRWCFFCRSRGRRRSLFFWSRRWSRWGLWCIWVFVCLDEWNLSTVWWEVLLKFEWRWLLWWSSDCRNAVSSSLSISCWCSSFWRGRASFNSSGYAGDNLRRRCLPWWGSRWLWSTVCVDWIDAINQINECEVKIVTDFGKVFFGYYQFVFNVRI